MLFSYRSHRRKYGIYACVVKILIGAGTHRAARSVRQLWCHDGAYIKQCGARRTNRGGLSDVQKRHSHSVLVFTRRHERATPCSHAVDSHDGGCTGSTAFYGEQLSSVLSDIRSTLLIRQGKCGQHYVLRNQFISRGLANVS